MESCNTRQTVGDQSVLGHGPGVEAGPRAGLGRAWNISGRKTRSLDQAMAELLGDKKAVERMQGRLGVDSVPGEGARFWFELRQAQPTR